MKIKYSTILIISSIIYLSTQFTLAKTIVLNNKSQYSIKLTVKGKQTDNNKPIELTEILKPTEEKTIDTVYSKYEGFTLDLIDDNQQSLVQNSFKGELPKLGISDFKVQRVGEMPPIGITYSYECTFEMKNKKSGWWPWSSKKNLPKVVLPCTVFDSAFVTTIEIDKGSEKTSDTETTTEM